MRDRQCALNHEATESAAIVSGVINKPTTVELCIYHMYTDDLLWRNFLSPQCRNCSRDPDHAPYTSATLSRLRGLSVSMTLRAMLAGELSPGRVTQARQVEG